MRLALLLVAALAGTALAHDRSPAVADAQRISEQLRAEFAPIAAACREGRALAALERATRFVRAPEGTDTATANARASFAHRELEGCLKDKRRDRKVRAAWAALIFAQAAQLERLEALAAAHELYARLIPRPKNAPASWTVGRDAGSGARDPGTGRRLDDLARARLDAARRALPHVAPDLRALEARLSAAFQRGDHAVLENLTDPDTFLATDQPDSGRAFVRLIARHWPAGGVTVRRGRPGEGPLLVISGLTGPVRSFAVLAGPRAGGVSWQGWAPW